MDSILLVSLAIGAIGVVVFLLSRRGGKDTAKKTPQQTDSDSQQAPQQKRRNKKGRKPAVSTSSSKAASKKSSGGDSKNAAAHALQVAVLKGHSGPVTSVAWSPDGQTLLSASLDRSLRLWRDLTDKNVPFTKINLQKSGCTAASFHSSGIAIVAALEDYSVQFYACKMTKTQDGKHKMQANLNSEFKAETGHSDLLSSAFLSTDKKMVVTCARGEDTKWRLWTPKGSLLAAVDTRQVVNFSAALSGDGRMVAVAGQFGDTRVWQVGVDAKTGVFSEVRVVLKLSGHRKGVNSVQFSNNDTQLVTGSIDGSWRLWNVEARYRDGQKAQLVTQCQTDFAQVHHVAIQPTTPNNTTSALVVAAVHEQSLSFYNSASGALLDQIASVCPQSSKARISSISFSPQGQLIAVASTDNIVRIFRVPQI